MNPVAVVSADPALASEVRALLESNGHPAWLAADGPDAAERLRREKPSLVVLAGPAPARAKALLAALRGSPSPGALSVFVVCPKEKPETSAELLEAGADDCLCRGFSARLFLARARSLLRRQVWNGALASPPTALRAGALELRLLERTATVGGKPVALTHLEFDLLAYLLARPGQAVARAELLKSVWNLPPEVETRTLDKHVESVRRKLGREARLLQTVHGVGYRLSASEA